MAPALVRCSAPGLAQGQPLMHQHPPGTPGCPGLAFLGWVTLGGPFPVRLPAASSWVPPCTACDCSCARGLGLLTCQLNPRGQGHGQWGAVLRAPSTPALSWPASLPAPGDGESSQPLLSSRSPSSHAWGQDPEPCHSHASSPSQSLTDHPLLSSPLLWLPPSRSGRQELLPGTSALAPSSSATCTSRVLMRRNTSPPVS